MFQGATAFLGGLDYLILNHAHLDIGDVFGPYNNDDKAYQNLVKIFDINFFSYVKLLSASMPFLKISGGKVGVISSSYGM